LTHERLLLRFVQNVHFALVNAHFHASATRSSKGHLLEDAVLDRAQTLEVIAHERYKNLLSRKNVLNKGFIDFTTRTRLDEAPDGTQFLLRDRTSVDASLVIDSGGRNDLSTPATAPNGQLIDSARPAAGQMLSGPLLTDVSTREREGNDVAASLRETVKTSRQIQTPIVEVRSVESRLHSLTLPT
jgi:hypothetical protein